MPTEQQIFATLDRYRDRTLQAFEDHLEELVKRAQSATLARILTNLKIENGQILPTARNRRVLQSISEVFMEQMEKAGANRLVAAFVNSFPQQLPSIHEVLELLSEQVKTPFPELRFTVRDKQLLAQTSRFMNDSIMDAIERQADTISASLKFAFGQMPFKNVIAVIQEGFSTTVAHAESVAETSQATFFRIALDRQYQRIETAQKQEMSYRYSGPRDERNRPFCAKMMAQSQAGKTWTRDELNALDNGLGQPKPVFLFCGGWRCRHQLVPDIQPG